MSNDTRVGKRSCEGRGATGGPPVATAGQLVANRYLDRILEQVLRTYSEALRTITPRRSRCDGPFRTRRISRPFHADSDPVGALFLSLPRIAFLLAKSGQTKRLLCIDFQDRIAVVFLTRPFHHGHQRAVMNAADLLQIILVAVPLEHSSDSA